MNEFIICAAIKVHGIDKVFYGHRHDQCFTAMNSELSWTMNRQEINQLKKEQGFITNMNRFVNREEGLIIALANNQIINKDDIRGEKLYSEDLY